MRNGTRGKFRATRLCVPTHRQWHFRRIAACALLLFGLPLAAQTVNVTETVTVTDTPMFPNPADTEQITVTDAVSVTVADSSTSTTLTASPNPAVFDQPVTLTAIVTTQSGGAATGTVTFYDGSTMLGSNNLSGNSASLSGIAFGVGTQNLTATYSGSSGFLGSTSNILPEVVNQVSTGTVITSSANPAYLPGQATVTLTARVTSAYGGPATGTVTFKEGKTILANASLVGNIATYSDTFTGTGTFSFTAVYSGDSNNLGSTSATFKQKVDNLPAPSTTGLTSSGPSDIGQTVTFTSTTTSTYGPIPDNETVTFYDGTTELGTGSTSGGVASFSTSFAAAKKQTISATYAGDATFQPSTGKMTQIVSLDPSTTTVTSTTPNPSNSGQSVTLTATVTSNAPGGPTGTVTFKNGSTTLGTETLSGGTATLVTKKLPVGADAITATYNGDSQDAKSTSPPVTQTVNPVLTITTTSLPDATVGILYSVQLAATAGTPPYTWSCADPPKGLSLSASGLLSGYLSETGTFKFTVTVVDSVGDTASARLTLVVKPL